MKILIAVILAALLVPSGTMLGAARKKRSTAKKGVSSAARKGAKAKKSTATPARTRTVSARSTTRKGTSEQGWRSRQLQPTSDRCRQIQEALSAKGYLQGEATGSWDQNSQDAMRRFQLDQKLGSTGKVDSLSLIALGLGPKYDTTAATAAPPVLPAQ